MRTSSSFTEGDILWTHHLELKSQFGCNASIDLQSKTNLVKYRISLVPGLRWQHLLNIIWPYSCYWYKKRLIKLHYLFNRSGVLPNCFERHFVGVTDSHGCVLFLYQYFFKENSVIRHGIFLHEMGIFQTFNRIHRYLHNFFLFWSFSS